MLWWTVTVMTVLFLPICVSGEGYFVKASKKLFWCVRLYGILPITGGFFYFSAQKIWVYRKNKLNSMPIATILRENKTTYEVAKGFYLSSVGIVIEGGNPERPAETLFSLQAVNTALVPILSALKTKKNAVKVKVYEIFMPKESRFSVTLRARLWLTPGLLILAIIKNFLNERLKNVKRRRKQAF